jgi:hypothetical protein
VGDHLTLRLDDGGTLTLDVDDGGRIRYRIDPGAGNPMDPPVASIGGLVPDELGLASLAVWSRDRLRDAR